MLVIKSLKELRGNVNNLQPGDKICFDILGYRCCGVIVEGFQYAHIHEWSIDGRVGGSIGNRTPFEKLYIDDCRHSIASRLIQARRPGWDRNTAGDWPAMHFIGEPFQGESRRHLLVDLASLIYIGCDMCLKNNQAKFQHMARDLFCMDDGIYDRAYNTFLNYGRLKPTFGEQ